jgi:selenocysteine lyase/cysteine desulfurase
LPVAATGLGPQIVTITLVIERSHPHAESMECMDRRHFLTHVAGAGTLAALRPQQSAALERTAAAGLESRAATGGSAVLGSAIRPQFPLTAARTYLNNGGLGPSPQCVINAVTGKMQELEQSGETGHSGDLWDAVQTKAAAVLGCDPDEVALTRNTTEGANIVCNGLPLRAGDEVISTTHEHVGNTVAWLARQRREGIIVRSFTPSVNSPQETLDRLQRLVSPRTRAISLSHVTCATGQILPVNEIGQLAADRGIWFFVDGAQAAGMMPVDVHRMGCHAYATSGHKWLLGPKGTGLLYVRRDMLDTIRPTFVGAYSASGAANMMTTGEFSFTHSAQRYEYGTVNAPLVHGLDTALGFILDLGTEAIWRHDQALAAELKTGLEALGADVLSPRKAETHSGIITFRVTGRSYQEVQSFLAEKHSMRTRGIYEGGLDGVRISLHLYNSMEEVQAVLEAVALLMKA